MYSVSLVRNLLVSATIGAHWAWSASAMAQAKPTGTIEPEPRAAPTSRGATQSVAASEPSASETAATSAESQTEAKHPVASRAQSSERPIQCVPACRSGFTCIAGRCVSACNPPCEAGEFCTGDGQCRQKPVAERKTSGTASDTHARNPGMLAGGMILSSVGAFVGILGYLRIRRDQFRCDSGQSEWCSTPKPGVALSIAGGVMFAVGIPFVLVGGWRVPNATRTSLASPPEPDGLTLRVSAHGVSLSGAF
jgi:hypothetical protein